MTVTSAIPTTLQESLLALLIFDTEWGTLASTQVTTDHFDTNYQDIAGKILQYRRDYKKPPGREHIDDIFGFALQEGKRSVALRQRIEAIIGLHDSGGYTPEFVAKRVGVFVRSQSVKTAILAAGERYNAGGDEAERLDDVESILYRALTLRQGDTSPSLRLNDIERGFAFLDARARGFPIGIKEFDRIGVAAIPKRLLLYIAPKGTGKTWFCVHMGKQGLLHEANVLHVSLEDPTENIAERYYMALFHAARKDEKYREALLELDELKRLQPIKDYASRRPSFAFNKAADLRKLKEKIRSWGLRLGRIVIKDFPSGTLTLHALSTYLDYLEQVEKFTPDILLLDYPKLMKLDVSNIRLDLGQTVVGLRGLAGERGMAMICPHQGTRETIGGKQTRSRHAGEDISVVQTADTVITCSKTDAEKRMGTARLMLEHQKGAPDGYTVVITQAYSVGQYVLKSALMSGPYMAQVMSNPDAED